MKEPSQQDIDYLVEKTLAYMRTKLLNNLDDHLEENTNDPKSVWSQIGLLLSGTSVEIDNHNIKLYWCTDHLGYTTSVNERLSNNSF